MTRVAVLLEVSELVVQAVTDGGGPLIDLDAAPEALVWLTPDDADGLQQALDAAPSVRWVQLPFAGVERGPAAGVLQPDRTWTCVKGAYIEPLLGLVHLDAGE